MIIRTPGPADHAAITALNDLAFKGSTLESAATLAVRAAYPDRVIESVAEDEGEIIGHIILHPAQIERAADKPVEGFALGPVCAAPHRRKEGVGRALMRDAMVEAERRGAPFIFLIGHADYYPRFGFGPAGRLGIDCPYDNVPDAAWMIAILDRHAMADVEGAGRYDPVFNAAIGVED